MVSEGPLFDDKIWKLLAAIYQLEDAVTMSEFLECNQASQQDLFSLFALAKSYDLGIVISENQKGEKVIEKVMKNQNLNINVNILEWFALQALFPKPDKFGDREFSKTLMEKFSAIHTKYPKLDLYKHHQNSENKEKVIKGFPPFMAKFIKLIERGIKEFHLLNIELKNGEKKLFRGQKIVYMDGKLSLIAEDWKLQCLSTVALDKIMAIELSGQVIFKTIYTNFEINEFISMSRGMSGQEERLVLKIIENSTLDLTPPYQYFGNPYLTSTMNGDLIWAASIEVSESTFQWLFSIRDKVEILDPSEFKVDFVEYCCKRDMENNLKKAS